VSTTPSRKTGNFVAAEGLGRSKVSKAGDSPAVALVVDAELPAGSVIVEAQSTPGDPSTA
jgi:hypothetical protein